MIVRLTIVGSSWNPAGSVCFGATGNRARQEPARGVSGAQSTPTQWVMLAQTAAQCAKLQL